MFNNLVDFTEDISKAIDPFLSSILITDTTGIEAYVTENNLKFYQSQLKKSKTYSKYLAKTNHDAKLTYLNGHFRYFVKSIISTNTLGLVRNVNFCDSGFDADDNYAYLHEKSSCLLSI